MAERLQKWLANRGLASRRELEAWITAGRITVNGEVAELGRKVTGQEEIRVDGRPVKVDDDTASPPRSILYHKPIGEICTRTDPQGRPTVFERLPPLRGRRWISVGRLDVQTSGLLIFTTDGELAHRLMHPSAGLQREYAVRVQGPLPEDASARLSAGIELEDGPARFRRIEQTGGEGSNNWYRVVVDEGRNRLVRRMFEAVGGRVSRLIRVRFGPLELSRDLPRGKHRPLRPGELSALYRAVRLQPPGDVRLAKRIRRRR
jgi:23S rRNA pseudouridine2605 synthase